MIVYDSYCFNLHLLWTVHGSVFPRASLFGAVSAFAAAMLYAFGPDSLLNNAWRNPFGYQVFAFVVGFALVFRSSLAYQRFWEARTMVQTITGRLSFYTVETLSLDLWAKPEELSTPEARRAAYVFCKQLMHLASMTFALMLKHLRNDWDVDDMHAHNPKATPPSLDALEGVKPAVKWQVFFFRCLALNDCFHTASHMLDTDMPVIGGVSQEEREMLAAPLDTLELQGKGTAFRGTRVLVMYGLITRLFFARSGVSPGLKAQPSTLSQLNGSLQEAMAGFGQCSKLASTRFPFPWAQCVMVFMVMLAISLPFVMVAFIREPWMGVALTFITIVTYWSLNEVASEMEDPFGLDPNDLPMARYCFDFNQGLVSAMHRIRPVWFDEIERQEQEQQRAVVGKEAADAPTVVEILLPAGGNGPLKAPQQGRESTPPRSASARIAPVPAAAALGVDGGHKVAW